MFGTIKQIFKKTNKDLRQRILFTLCALLVFALGNAITVPGMKAITNDLGFLELLNAMSGGGLKQFSIFALGVMPYISGSILIQMLQIDALGISYFKELKEMGEAGRRKINRINRYIGMGFAVIEGFVYAVMFVGKSATAAQYFEITLVLTAGTAFLLWLGDQITAKGIGNGVSLIIMAGIINTLPSMFIQVFQTLVLDNTKLYLGILSFALFVILYIAIVIGVIFSSEAERRIPIQYSNRSNTAYGGKQTYLPLKLNSANVMPVIFASFILAIPTMLTYIIKSTGYKTFVDKYLTTTTPVGLIVYVVLIIAFAYFYTFVAEVNPEELSKNLNESGGYIPGVRPGKETTKYISSILSKITFIGAIFLAIIAILPILFTKLSGMPSSVTVGGTGLIIVVGVLLETYKQLESSVASRSYNRR